MRTQVAIIGGGPSGLLLSQLLNRRGVATVVLERRSRAHVLSRIRAGVLEWGTVELAREAGVGARMDAHGITHDGCLIANGDDMFRVDFHAACGKSVMVYGQTELTADLYRGQDEVGAAIIHEAEDVALHDLDGDRPYVTYSADGVAGRVDCDFIAGCDGFHGVARQSIPAASRREYHKDYPFGWLGILSNTSPVADELIYSRSARGFALASMRSATLSRYYIQVPLTDRPEDWSDDAFWGELRERLPAHVRPQLETGRAIEKSIAPLRSFVCEPLRHGRLFLCGDAGHIVPPTGAKGLNLAASDVHYLYEGLSLFYAGQDSSGLDAYSTRALARVWQAMRFSWSMTMMLHAFPDHDDFDRRMQEADLLHLARSASAQRAMAENYTGLPF